MSEFRSHSAAAAGGDSSRSSAADMLKEGQDRQESSGIQQARDEVKQSFYNYENPTDLILDPGIRPRLAAALRSGRFRAIMPMYRDMAALHTVKYMLDVLGSPSRVTVVNGGSPLDDVCKAVQALGVEVLQVGDLRRLVPAGKLYDLLAWNERAKDGSVKIPVGKGMSIFWLHLYDEVVRQPAFPDDTITLQIDSDITNIGSAPDKYNPLYYLALPWVMDPDRKYVHAKTASPGRNNEPMMPGRNALQAFADAGVAQAGIYARFTQRLKWMLTGEFAFGTRKSIRNMPHSSGYGAETLLAMYLAQLYAKGEGDTAQVAIRVPRVDASNTYEKEYVMYDQLTYLLTALVIKTGAQPGALGIMPAVDSLTVADVQEIDKRMARRDYFTILGEKPGPCEVVSTVNDRIIPSIDQMMKAGYVDAKVVDELRGK